LAGASACGCASRFVLFDKACVPLPPPPVCPAGYEIRDVLRYPVCVPCPTGTWNEENGERCRLIPPPLSNTTTTGCSIQGGEPTFDGGCGCPPNTEPHLFKNHTAACVACQNGTRSTFLGLSPCIHFVHTELL
jgi:hypothetical protein